MSWKKANFVSVEDYSHGANDLPKEVAAAKRISAGAEGIVTSAPRLKTRLLGASTQVPPEPRLTHLPQGRAASQRFAAWRQCTHCKTRATKTCTSRDCEYALTHRNRHPLRDLPGRASLICLSPLIWTDRVPVSKVEWHSTDIKGPSAESNAAASVGSVYRST